MLCAMLQINRQPWRIYRSIQRWSHTLTGQMSVKETVMWALFLCARACRSDPRRSSCAPVSREAPPRCLKWQRGLLLRRCRCGSSGSFRLSCGSETLLLLICRHRVSPSQIIREKTSEEEKKKKKPHTSRSPGKARPERAGFRLRAGSICFLFFLSFSFSVTVNKMRGLLSFYRGLHTLSNRQARRKAGTVGSRCGFCGTHSNSKVRSELLLLLRPAWAQADTLSTEAILCSELCPEC